MDPVLTFWQKPNFIPRLGLVIGVVLVAILGYGVYLNSVFRITGTNPNTSNVATSAPFLKINFNKPLNDTGLSVSGSGGIVRSYSASGKTVTVLLNGPLVLSRRYDVHLNSVISTGGKLITDKTISFVPKAVDYNKLPQDQQQTLLNEQDTHQGANTDPIVSHLPYGTLDFKLNDLVTTDASNKSVLVLQATILVSHADMSNEAAAVAQYKQEVLDYITSLGLKPSNYTINYTINEPAASAVQNNSEAE